MVLIGEFPKIPGKGPAHIGAFALKILKNFYKYLTLFTDKDLYGNSELIL